MADELRKVLRRMRKEENLERDVYLPVTKTAGIERKPVFDT